MTLDVRLDDGVGVVTLDRPEKFNAMTVELVAALDDAVGKLVGDGAKAMVLAGRGRMFSAGADLGLVRAALDGEPATVLGPLVDTLHAAVRRLRAAPFPTVAAVEGSAVGAGMGLALATDLRVVGRSARFVPAYLAIGASPDGGVSYWLSRALGAVRATALLVRNQPVAAAELAALGLADEVVDDGAATEAAIALARTLTNLPPGALRRTRDLVDRASTQGLDAQLDAERDAIAAQWRSADFREGVTAFLEKRPPRFTGS